MLRTKPLGIAFPGGTEKAMTRAGLEMAKIVRTHLYFARPIAATASFFQSMLGEPHVQAQFLPVLRQAGIVREFNRPVQ